MTTRRQITRELAAYAAHSSFAALPEIVRRETARAFLNWMGCVLGGCRDPAVGIAAAAVAETGSRPVASMIGRGERADLAGAALVNCFASSVLAYDDTHLATVTHPTGPVAAAIFALSEKQTISGEDFVNALAVGMEIECRMSNVLLLPPAKANVALYVTGLTGPIGAAAALGRLLQFDEQRMSCAIGLAAAQAAGFRGTHGSMAGLLVPALGARDGVAAAILASKGLTCTGAILEGEKGFVDVFSPDADVNHAINGLGRDFELLANAYKPYPCGIVIHAALDACLQLAEKLAGPASFTDVVLTVPPLTLSLTDRRSPANPVEAQISLYHWAAAALLRRSASLAEMRQDCIDDPQVAALRARIEAVADPSLGRDEAIVEATRTDGSRLRAHVAHARGSADRPMTDQELDAKFRQQANLVLPASVTEELLRSCRSVAGLGDVGKDIAALWKD